MGLHVGSTVVAQFTIDGKHHLFPAQVTHLPQPGGDPDKVQVSFLCNISDEENLLESPVTFNRTMQHGAKGRHATFRLVGEDD